MIGFPLQGDEIQMCGVSATEVKEGTLTCGYVMSHTLQKSNNHLLKNKNECQNKPSGRKESDSLF